MIKLAIIHFPRGLCIDVNNNKGNRAYAASPPYNSASRLPEEYTLSFIDLTLSLEEEQEFLHLVRKHQEKENELHIATQISPNLAAIATEPNHLVVYNNQKKALRGLNLMSNYINSLPSTDSDKHKCLNLTSREIDIMELLCQGLLDKEIADRLCISINTVKNHIKNIYAKLRVKNRIEALRIFLLPSHK